MSLAPPPAANRRKMDCYRSILLPKKTEFTKVNSAFYDPDENRTRVTAVKGRCLNRLTTGPYLVAAVGFEPTTPRV